ncbi:MAG: hypothetical protein WAT61_08025, partial [Flavobacteriales bacterium]
MKKTIYLIPLMAMLAACGTKGTSDVAQKVAERDSLKAEYAALGVKIKEVETWLVENDSSIRRNLSSVTAVPLAPGSFAHYVDVH